MLKCKVTQWNDEDCYLGLCRFTQCVDWIDPAQDMDKLRYAWFQASAMV